MLTDASVPGQFPAQDHIDRAAHVAVIARLDLEYPITPDLDLTAVDRASSELRTLFSQIVHDTIDELFPSNTLPDVRSEHYQVGPAAGGIADLAHLIITLAEYSDQLTQYLDDVPTYYFFYRMAVHTKRRITDWARNLRIPGFHVVFSYTPEDLKLLAEGYVHELLDGSPTGRTLIHCLTEEFYDGYQSPAHPTESLEYLIVVPTETGSYRFRVMGDSKILELVIEDDAGERRLEALEFLDGESDGDE